MKRIGTILLACAIAACATSGTAGSGGDTSTSGQTSLLGRAEQFAGTAMTVAKNFLSQNSAPSAPSQQDKTQAAQAGVAAANTQAQHSQGSALSQFEQKALLDYVKSKL